MRLAFYFFSVIFLHSCGSSAFLTTQEIPPTKQKQRIAFLQKKLQLAAKEEQKIHEQVEKLGDEVREAQLAYIRGQIDTYEAHLSKQFKRRPDWENGDLFYKERELLHQMIQNGHSSFEAQLVLDRILQVITELNNPILE